MTGPISPQRGFTAEEERVFREHMQKVHPRDLVGLAMAAAIVFPQVMPALVEAATRNGGLAPQAPAAPAPAQMKMPPTVVAHGGSNSALSAIVRLPFAPAPATVMRAPAAPAGAPASKGLNPNAAPWNDRDSVAPASAVGKSALPIAPASAPQKKGSNAISLEKWPALPAPK